MQGISTQKLDHEAKCFAEYTNESLRRLLYENGWLAGRTFGTVAEVFTQIRELLEHSFKDHIQTRLLE